MVLKCSHTTKRVTSISMQLGISTGTEESAGGQERQSTG
jgi:hypothetical protein